jgi:hypothetical protein
MPRLFFANAGPMVGLLDGDACSYGAAASAITRACSGNSTGVRVRRSAHDAPPERERDSG